MTIEQLKAMDVKDLKVLAFDTQIEMKRNESNLQIILQIIADKQNVKVPEKEEIIEQSVEEVKEEVVPQE